jgi:alanine-glyoxylate transaminase/serine-glyoxylate transaminase/serine-pyruvate transaminase
MGLHAALRRILDEGLEARFERHRRAHLELVEGLAALDFEMLVDERYRLPMLNTVIPPVDDEAALRRRLLSDFDIEVGGGLGKLAGRVWRIGLMGDNACSEVVTRLLEALRQTL